MDEKEISKLSGIDRVEADKFQIIGGWLRFFQVITVIEVVLYFIIFVLGISIYAYQEVNSQDWIDMLSMVLESAPVFIFSILILNIIGKKSEEIPSTLKFYLFCMMILSMVVGVALLIAYNMGYITIKPSSVLGSVIYYFIWATYFKRSKRVKVFYGKNA